MANNPWNGRNMTAPPSPDILPPIANIGGSPRPGFTREDVLMVLACADWDEQRAAQGRNDWKPEGRAKLRALANRIAALLPPRGAAMKRKPFHQRRRYSRRRPWWLKVRVTKVLPPDMPISRRLLVAALLPPE